MERLVIDTETTGLSPHHNQMLTLGMVLIDVNKRKLNFLEDKHIFIRHDDYHVSEMAMRINKIDIEQHHKKASPIKKALKEINNFLKKNNLFDTTIVGHNVSFDKRFVSALFEQQGHIYPFCREQEDTMYIWNNLKKRGIISPLKNAKLRTVAEHFDIDYSHAHDALEDCKITAKVYHEMLKLSPKI
jgi:DNA polymerase III alpha subunit (gram-positive type)